MKRFLPRELLCPNNLIPTSFFMFVFQPWEKKRIQSQVVERENTYTSRPSTSSRRLPSRSLNGALDTSVIINRRLSMGIHQLPPNSINSGNQGVSFIKDGSNALRKKIFGDPAFTSHMRWGIICSVNTRYTHFPLKFLS